MWRLTYFVFFLLFFCEELLTEKKEDIRQSGATIKYCDPAYVTNCKAITKRPSRQEPYRTNITGTSLQPWHNNVTLRVVGYGRDFTVKMCDIMKIKWLSEYMSAYSNFPSAICPIPPMKYNLWNMQFPPKNFPWIIPVNDVNLKFIIELTETRKRIAECYVHLGIN